MSILSNPFEALGELMSSSNTEAPVSHTELAPEAKDVWYSVRVTGGKAELKLANVILLTDAEFLAPQTTVAVGKPAMPAERPHRVTSFATVQTAAPAEAAPIISRTEAAVPQIIQAPIEITPETTPEVIPAKNQANTDAQPSVDVLRANLAEIYAEAA